MIFPRWFPCPSCAAASAQAHLLRTGLSCPPREAGCGTHPASPCQGQERAMPFAHWHSLGLSLQCFLSAPTGETFSEFYSHTEACQPCTKCGRLLRMKAPCTESADAICICDYGYFKDMMNDQCMPCTICPLGQGVYTECTEDRDTTCEQCPEGTYSDQDSSMDPCLPCTSAMRMTRRCWSLTILGLWPPLVAPRCPQASCVTATMTPTNTVTTTNPSSSQINATIMDKNLIPIYCSILAAVVVGLVAYIVFKRWNSCKQNKQAANNRTVNQTPSPEGEKLHSDSGISVDSQSLQEQQQGKKVAWAHLKASSCPYANLPTHKQKELENLLKGSAEDDTDWCNLASLLGYQEGHIDAFRQGEHPVQELLSDWGNKDSATVDALCTALRKINREDIAECLSAEPTATSAV
uniref:Nerve growth factor receptor a (TNFR superfamily, member 16) n=1 Tax=Erpetoichthys calabaricus TaxID=27687 RepID=A0A8C4TI36_ERPCA